MIITGAQKLTFTTTVWDYYHEHGRHDLLWRLPESDGNFDPYKIMVSEVMLQQTQVARVTIKYQEFLTEFPTIERLAAAELGDVLRQWSGLGYNRRAKFLWQAAQMVVHEHAGVFPKTRNALTNLPGIGVNTAGAIMAYAYNEPVTFLETNIRTVYIHHFFADSVDVKDKDVQMVVEATLPEPGECRDWYWALMDYGSWLKKTVGNVSKLSSSYTKQSAFAGSLRQIRGQVLRELRVGPLTIQQLREHINDKRLPAVLATLVTEQLIKIERERYSL